MRSDKETQAGLNLSSGDNRHTHLKMNNHDNCGGKGATQTMRPWGVTVQLYFHVWVACSLSSF